MNNIHNKLTEKYSWYRKWHESSDSSLANWAFFFLITSIIFNFTVSSIFDSTGYDGEDQFAQAKAALDRRKFDLKEDLSEQADFSDVVVVGVVNKAETKLEKDENGDQLMVTHVKVSVLEWLKGTSGPSIEVDMVGGTLNGVTMKSSAEPDPLKAKDKAVFYLQKKSNGNYRITKDEKGAKQGLIKLRDRKRTDRIVNLDEIRSTTKETTE